MKNLALLPLLAIMLLFVPARAGAHCDSMNGPVVKDAITAIARNDVRLVLHWVRKVDEDAVKAAFAQTMRVRILSSDAAGLADRAFFETVVRLHRAGEGAPYTGLKDAGSVTPAVHAADDALLTGEIGTLREDLAQGVAGRVTTLFDHARRSLSREETDVEAGRRFVAAYVSYVHAVEALEGIIAGETGHEHEEHAGDAHHDGATGVDTAQPDCPHTSTSRAR